MMKFSGAIVKIASRCNLNCTYCYMYNLGDDTWKDQPALMSLATIDALVSRVAEHCKETGSQSFTYCFHGGEPLLMPRERLSYFVEAAHNAMPEGCSAQFVMQTNGVLLTDIWCQTLLELNVRVGVSLDGPADVNDAFRVDHKGKGSYANVVAGLATARNVGLEYGLLSVIDPSASPVDTYRHLAKLEPRSVDLLLPEATHETSLFEEKVDAIKYGEWLLAFFECWASSQDTPFRVRHFDQVIEIVLGVVPSFKSADMHHNEILVIETDGSIEPMDVLKACEPSITKTNFNVHANTFSEAALHPLINQYYFSHSNPCEKCSTCPIYSMCGGGYFPHRFKKSNGFDNPSVYCDGLQEIIGHIQRWTISQLPKDILQNQNVVPVE